MAKKVIIDYRTAPEAVAELNRLGFETVLTRPIKAPYPEIRGHADIQLHIFNKKAFCAPEVYAYYKEKLPELTAVCGSSALNAKYPCDIAYNTCHLGRYAVCGRRYTDEKLLSEYIRAGLEILNTRQGYARCNLCVVDHESAVTSDEGLYRLLAAHGLNVLKIREGHIRLYGMRGFIGGASGLIGEKLLAFNGDLGTHPDHEAIRAFCANSGVDVVSLNTGELCDIGSILTVS